MYAMNCKVQCIRQELKCLYVWQEGMLTLHMFFMPMAICSWVGALNAHTSFLYLVCFIDKPVCICLYSKLSSVCVCVCAHMVKQRLCVSSGVPSVSLSLITV